MSLDPTMLVRHIDPIHSAEQKPQQGGWPKPLKEYAFLGENLREL